MNRGGGEGSDVMKSALDDKREETNALDRHGGRRVTQEMAGE